MREGRVPNRRAEGDAFEDLACCYLAGKGYRILERNVYLMRKEVDIVAAHGDTIVFVEVKGRRSRRFGLPAEAVGTRKQQHLARLADLYLERKRLRDRPCRFDVVTVEMGSDRGPVFEHIENAFGV